MNELQLTTGPYRTTAVGIEIVRQSSKEEWHGYGEALRRLDEAKQWAIGDWLVDGKSHYGDGLYQEATRVLRLEETTLQTFKAVSDKFKEIPLRNGNLSWQHHKEVGYLKTLIEKHGKLQRSDEHDMEKAQELLAKAEKEGWSVRDLRGAVAEHVRRQDEAIRLANEPERYNVILADPAWEYEFDPPGNRAISKEAGAGYNPTTLEDMKNLQVPAASDSVLFMWATSPKLSEAQELLSAWGFTYKTCAVWVKDRIGMGYYFRQKHELLLIATRGNLQLPDEDKRPDSVFEAPRTDHSEKPEIVYQLIESMYPGYKKLEMFARQKRKGWASWGDEIE